MTESKVNEFLREISPMREAAFWHNFIAHLLVTETSDYDDGNGTNWIHPRLEQYETKENIENNRVIEARVKRPPPLPPKPKIFKPLQPAQNRFVQVPVIVLPSNQTINIDDRRHQFEEEEYHHKSLNNRPNAMETINGSNEIMENQMNVSNCVPMEASSSMDKSTTMSSETMANVDSNNNNNNNDEMKCQQQDPMCTNVSHDYSIESKPDIFHSKTSQTIRQSHSETRISSSPFQRTNSVPGNTTNRSYSNEPLSPKQPMFASSSFYDPRTHPTIEEQVSLCREIAKQLVSDVSNEKSKGRQMFERRVEKSSKWVTENEDSFQNYSSIEEDYHERTISDGPPNLRLLLDPRHVEDISTVQGVNEQITEAQQEQTRDTCKHIVQDLTSPEVNPNRGNVLFAKQAQKSEEWIIDDVAEQVIDAARDKLFRNVKHGSISSSPIPPMSPHYSRYSSPIAGPVFTPLDSSLPSTRPSSAMGSIYSRFKDFNSRPKPFGQAY